MDPSFYIYHDQQDLKKNLIPYPELPKERKDPSKIYPVASSFINEKAIQLANLDFIFNLTFRCKNKFTFLDLGKATTGSGEYFSHLGLNYSGDVFTYQNRRLEAYHHPLLDYLDDRSLQRQSDSVIDRIKVDRRGGYNLVFFEGPVSDQLAAVEIAVESSALHSYLIIKMGRQINQETVQQVVEHYRQTYLISIISETGYYLVGTDLMRSRIVEKKSMVNRWIKQYLTIPFAVESGIKKPWEIVSHWDIPSQKLTFPEPILAASSEMISFNFMTPVDRLDPCYDSQVVEGNNGWRSQFHFIVGQLFYYDSKAYHQVASLMRPSLVRNYLLKNSNKAEWKDLTSIVERSVEGRVDQEAINDRLLRLAGDFKLSLSSDQNISKIIIILEKVLREKRKWLLKQSFQ